MMTGRRFLLLLPIPLLLWMMVQAGISGYSYLIQYRTNAALENWQEEGVQPSFQAWQDLERSALTALSWDSMQPELLNAIGRLYGFRALRLAEMKDEKDQDLQHAAHYYRQVMKLRPAWPYGYLNLALLKANAGVLDAEFSGLLVHLTRLAPWDEKTLPLMVQMITRGWPYISVADRAELKPYLLLAARLRTNEVRMALQEYHSVNFFCAIINGKQPSKICGAL